ncbi:MULTISPECIES: hypothetical protein [unclassified Mesorhizobium]|nr:MULTISPECIES: hypothetical protein [unclassified Mesorhizobium]MBZ9981781.1 hypothetical protein [Mesorhizobium sp. BR-1-1-8]MCA0024236.1 hypothetical protein [Mesorhizobium sp. B263B1A]
MARIEAAMTGKGCGAAANCAVTGAGLREGMIEHGGRIELAGGMPTRQPA